MRRWRARGSAPEAWLRPSVLILAAALTATATATTATASEAPLAAWPAVHLFDVVRPDGSRSTVGIPPAAFDALGDAPWAERVTRALDAGRPVEAWAYERRRPEGGGALRWTPTGRVVLRRGEVRGVSPKPSAMWVQPPPP